MHIFRTLVANLKCKMVPVLNPWAITIAPKWQNRGSLKVVSQGLLKPSNGHCKEVTTIQFYNHGIESLFIHFLLSFCSRASPTICPHLSKPCNQSTSWYLVSAASYEASLCFWLGVVATPNCYVLYCFERMVMRASMHFTWFVLLSSSGRIKSHTFSLVSMLWS